MSDTQLAQLDIDLWSDEGIRDPYPLHKQLRDTPGPAWLPKYNMFVLSRYDDVRGALENWRVFSSAHGAMMNDVLNDVSRGVLLCSDPPQHDALRKAASKPLHPSELRKLEAQVMGEADTIVDKLVARGTFDVAKDLAPYLPIKIVSNLVGLPEEGRESMLAWAEALFNCIGPMNERTERSLPLVQEAFGFSADPSFRERLAPGRWAAQLFETADSGDITHADAVSLINDYWAPSLDTTILAMTSAIRLFGEHPEQWDLVREDPKLIPHAINEIVRLESPIQGFSRYLTEDYELDGVTMPAGSRAVVLYASANRDERKWESPEKFDVLRRPTDHLGFGAGEHRCMGLPMATMEMRAVLTALVSRVERFEIGDSEPLINNTLHGLTKLEVTVH